MSWKNRHPSVRLLEHRFDFGHIPEWDLRSIGYLFLTTANGLLERLHDGPELVGALQRLAEARDLAFLQAACDRDACISPALRRA